MGGGLLHQLRILGLDGNLQQELVELFGVLAGGRGSQQLLQRGQGQVGTRAGAHSTLGAGQVGGDVVFVLLEGPGKSGVAK